MSSDAYSPERVKARCGCVRGDCYLVATIIMKTLKELGVCVLGLCVGWLLAGV